MCVSGLLYSTIKEKNMSDLTEEQKEALFGLTLGFTHLLDTTMGMSVLLISMDFVQKMSDIYRQILKKEQELNIPSIMIFLLPEIIQDDLLSKIVTYVEGDNTYDNYMLAFWHNFYVMDYLENLCQGEPLQHMICVDDTFLMSWAYLKNEFCQNHSQWFEQWYSQSSVVTEEHAVQYFIESAASALSYSDALVKIVEGRVARDKLNALSTKLHSIGEKLFTLLEEDLEIPEVNLDNPTYEYYYLKLYRALTLLFFLVRSYSLQELKDLSSELLEVIRGYNMLLPQLNQALTLDPIIKRLEK